MNYHLNLIMKNRFSYIEAAHSVMEIFFDLTSHSRPIWMRNFFRVGLKIVIFLCLKQAMVFGTGFYQ